VVILFPNWGINKILSYRFIGNSFHLGYDRSDRELKACKFSINTRLHISKLSIQDKEPGDVMDIVAI
jgi:hypothetical protein